MKSDSVCFKCPVVLNCLPDKVFTRSFNRFTLEGIAFGWELAELKENSKTSPHAFLES